MKMKEEQANLVRGKWGFGKYGTVLDRGGGSGLTGTMFLIATVDTALAPPLLHCARSSERPLTCGWLSHRHRGNCAVTDIWGSSM
jgi:hypothetical protein